MRNIDIKMNLKFAWSEHTYESTSRPPYMKQVSNPTDKFFQNGLIYLLSTFAKTFIYWWVKWKRSKKIALFNEPGS